MDRLIALVLLRWTLDLRGLGFARERLLVLAFTLPFTLLVSVAGAAFLYLGVRALSSADPELLLPALSAAATLVGLFWTLSPLLAGLALAESHDLGRLMHFPVPPRVLAAASLIANLAQPMVLAELPMVAAVAAALARSPATFPLALAGVALSFATILASAHLVALVLHRFSRSRRLQDVSLFASIGIGFVIGVLPLALLWGGSRPLLEVARLLRAADLFALAPFAWGVRAAVHGGSGELVGFAAWSALSVAAIGAMVAASAALVHRMFRGELDLGEPGAAARGTRARMRLPGAIGALVEKDLRVTWRDPALKAALIMGVIGPLVLALFLAQGGRGGRGLLYLASFVGLSAFGSNAFGLERRGIALLMGFPVERWRILVGKNASALVFRVPAVLVLLGAALVIGPAAHLPNALAIMAATVLVSAGVDNYAAILFPISHPAPGESPQAARAGGRGLGAALFSFVLLGGTFLLSLPFAFLCWMPILFGSQWLALLSLPLAVAGAGAVYAMLVAGAARLLEGREPELMERILG